MAKYPDLSKLTLEDCTYLRAFNGDICEYIPPIEWLKEKPYDRKKIQTLTNNYRLNEEIAINLIKLGNFYSNIHEEMGDTFYDYDGTNYEEEEFIDLFIDEAQRFLLVKSQIKDSSEYGEVLREYVNYNPYYLDDLIPINYIRHVLIRTAIFTAIAVTLLLIDSIFEVTWLGYVAGGIIGGSWATSLLFTPRRYKALRKLTNYLEGQGIVLKSKDEPIITPQNLTIDQVHIYDKRMYGGKKELQEKDHMKEVSTQQISKLTQTYGFNLHVARDILQHYFRDNAKARENLDIKDPYYLYVERFQVKGFRDAFNQELAKADAKPSSLWWLLLCLACGIALVLGGTFKFFFEHSGHPSSFDKLGGLLFFGIGITYIWVYGKKIMARINGK